MGSFRKLDPAVFGVFLLRELLMLRLGIQKWRGVAFALTEFHYRARTEEH